MSRKVDELWAITSYFNPVGYRRRLQNYRLFRQRFPVPLVTAELTFGDGFELSADDADILVQLKSRDVLWQKERLLEIALQAVPASCRKVMWVDCDVVFEGDDWPDRVCLRLEDFPILQPFDEVQDLEPDTLPGSDLRPPIATGPSFASALAVACATGDADVFRFRHQPSGRRGNPAAGFAWCFRRELLENHGLYSGGIVGGNDRALACAACGQFEAAFRNWQMNDAQRRHYLEWAQPFFQAIRGRVGFVQNRIYHLWHGDLKRRRYRERHLGLKPFAFDPYRDIATDDHGCWCWSSKKPALHAYVKDHFVKRREDEMPAGPE